MSFPFIAFKMPGGICDTQSSFWVILGCEGLGLSQKAYHERSHSFLAGARTEVLLP